MTTRAQYEEAFQSLLKQNTDQDWDRIERMRNQDCFNCGARLGDHGYSIVNRKVTMFCEPPRSRLERVDEATHHH